MPEGRIRAMAVGVRSAMRVDWIALSAGIIGAGIAMIALMILLERNSVQSPDCAPHLEQAHTEATVDPCAP